MVRIEPKDFNRELSEAISDTLNAKLANKVLKDVGKQLSMISMMCKINELL